MWVRAKDKLTKPKHNKGHAADNIGSLGKSPNPMGQLHIPTHPFPQLILHGLLLGGKLNIAWVHITKDRQQQLVFHILQGHDNLAARKEEGMDGTVRMYAI